MWNVVYPHFLIDRVVDVTPALLRSLDLNYLLLDVDCTLKRYSEETPQPDVLEWLDSMKRAGIGMCLLSNGVGERIGKFAERVALPYVAKACKPFPSGCRRACREHSFDPSRTAVIGDQIFADVMAGRLAGLRVFLTTPISPEEEHWFTRVKRPFERVVLRSFRKRFPDGKWISQSDSTRANG